MFFLFVILIGAAQVYKDDISALDSMSAYIQKPTFEYTLSALDSDNKDTDTIYYKPHISSFSGISLSKGMYSLSLSVQNEDEENADVRESDLLDFQVMGFYKNFLWEAYYQKYDGLYITDSNFVASDLPKANATSVGVEVKYFSKEGFELKKSLSSFSLDKKTDWSWLYGMGLSRSRLYSNDVLVPAQYNQSFDQLIGLSSIRTTNLGVDIGLAGMVNFYKFFLSSKLTYGLMYQNQEFTGIDTDKREISTAGTSVMLDLGRDWSSSTLGAQLRARTIDSPVKNAHFVQTRVLIQFYYKLFF